MTSSARTATTVKADLQWGYDSKKELVKRALQNALSSVHIVPDNWTSPNGLGAIGFTVQFVAEDQGVQSLVVRIKELEGQHSGENMAEAIMEFIREYGIASKVCYFMMDNAANMNSMIDKVSDELEHEFDVFYDPLPHRLRCVGHIINLALTTSSSIQLGAPSGFERSPSSATVSGYDATMTPVGIRGTKWWNGL
jgi:hypothetical protein